MKEDDFDRWLHAYGQAWTNGDVPAVLRLFASEAQYFETPFDPPLVGHEEIQHYWTEGAATSQRHVRFSYEILSTQGQSGLAHWQATFRRVPGALRVALDGIIYAQFDEQGRCMIFREWWHRKESAP